ncbi:MAG TPA: glycogen synthase [Steroidobacteraceae bacterium]|nr:glycogen synthase [Steroidobacteraceae bacterium]
MALSICAIASEAAPFAKTGGLADVTAALTKYLAGAGHDVRLFVPLYSSVDRARFPLSPAGISRSTTLGAHTYAWSVHIAALPNSSARVHMVDCPALYARGGLYTSDGDDHRRFLLLTRAALECCQHLGFQPDILHCHDWHAAFGPLFLRTLYGWDRLFAGTRSVLTIHNIGYQGVFAAHDAADLGLGDNAHLLHQDDLKAGRINALKHGCMYADAITTVSPTYAREIRTPQYGMGLEDILRARGAALTGILNGVDYDEWDPRTDRYVDLNYDASSVSVKGELKARLLTRLHLPVAAGVPLIGMVSRLAAQKGIELTLAALPRLLAARKLAFVALGSGEGGYEYALGQLQRDFPGRVVCHRGYNEELAHWIEAAGDLFLMPSLYEPCGLNQMYSLRYGTVPVVRRTGGLADSVQPYDPATGTGTGIVFEEPSAAALEAALGGALGLYAQPQHWRRLQANGMAQDFSWARQGAQYVALYEQLLA